MHTKFWSGNLSGKDHFGDLSVGARIMLKWIERKQVVRMWTGFI